MNKLLSAIDVEIEDRTTQAGESGEPEKYEEELKGLNELRAKVAAQSMLSFSEYEWLADILADARENEVLQ